MAYELIRRVIVRPYRKRCGPAFTLAMFDTGRRDSRGCTRIAYTLHMTGRRGPLFNGSDFCASPLHADDSDSAVAGLIGFLTLRPGDTDSEYFDSYTQAQLDYCSEHAESLSCACRDRFGED